jgi:hypothetical protein
VLGRSSTSEELEYLNIEVSTCAGHFLDLLRRGYSPLRRGRGMF